MTEETNNDYVAPDELTTLKTRADQMGIKYNPNIGLDKLRLKVNTAIAPVEAQEIPSKAVVKLSPVETIKERNERLRLESSKLVRFRLVCMNPEKKDWPGEYITTGNKVVGTFTRFIPFDADEGWHAEQIIFNVLKSRECQVFYSKLGPRGETIKRGKMIKEFAIEVLPALNEVELKELATRQALAGNIG